MTIRRVEHPAAETLELYAFGRLQEPELGQFEVHILLCPTCRSQLDETTELMEIMREATRRACRAPNLRQRLAQWLDLSESRIQVPAMAAAFSVFAVLVAWYPWTENPQLPAQTIALQAWRSNTSFGAAQTNMALTLQLDTTGLPTMPLSVDIVSLNGEVLLRAPAVLAEDQATIQVHHGLAAGRYWVRLRTASETLREFALVVAEPRSR